MELREIMSIIFQSRRLFITGIVAGVLLGSLAADTMQGRLKASATILVIQARAQSSKDYAYDSYYVLETTERLAKSLVLYLRRPDVLNAILEPKLKNRNLRFSTFGDQGIGMTFTPTSREDAQVIYDKLIQHLTRTFEALLQPTAGGTVYDLKFGPLYVPQYDAPQLFLVLVGALVGAAGSMIFLVLRTHLRSPRANKTRRHENRS